MPKLQLRYSCDYSDELVQQLQIKGIKYDVRDLRPTIQYRSISFSINSNELIDEAFCRLVNQHQTTCFKKLQFSKKEMDSAEWFSMWCDNMKVEARPDVSTYLYECEYNKIYAKHRKQVQPFWLKKGIKWNNNRNFIALLGEPTCLFVNGHTRNLLQESVAHDIEYLSVINRATGEPYDTVFQFSPQTVIPRNDIIIEESDSCRKVVCQYCGKTQYDVDGAFRLMLKKTNYLSEHDVLKTERLFGAGFARDMIIVSKRFYSLIEDNQLGRTLHFEPIIIV